MPSGDEGEEERFNQLLQEPSCESRCTTYDGSVKVCGQCASYLLYATINNWGSSPAAHDSKCYHDDFEPNRIKSFNIYDPDDSPSILGDPAQYVSSRAD